MTPIEREALELAETRCVGHPYTIQHIEAWKRLKSRGLVRVVKSDTGSWYELTRMGRVVLKGTAPPPRPMPGPKPTPAPVPAQPPPPPIGPPDVLRAVALMSDDEKRALLTMLGGAFPDGAALPWPFLTDQQPRLKETTT